MNPISPITLSLLSEIFGSLTLWSFWHHSWWLHWRGVDTSLQLKFAKLLLLLLIYFLYCFAFGPSRSKIFYGLIFTESQEKTAGFLLKLFSSSVRCLLEWVSPLISSSFLLKSSLLTQTCFNWIKILTTTKILKICFATSNLNISWWLMPYHSLSLKQFW